MFSIKLRATPRNMGAEPQSSSRVVLPGHYYYVVIVCIALVSLANELTCRLQRWPFQVGVMP